MSNTVFLLELQFVAFKSLQINEILSTNITSHTFDSYYNYNFVFVFKVLCLNTSLYVFNNFNLEKNYITLVRKHIQDKFVNEINVNIQ